MNILDSLVSTDAPPSGYIIGSDASELLNGFNVDDRIEGRGGNDTIFGFDDTDRLFGNQGTDLIYGNTGNDTINGGEGSDTIYGGKDNDLISGDLGSDFISGDIGNDTLIGVSSTHDNPGLNEIDTLTGGEGTDVFILGNSSNVYYNSNLGFGGLSDYALITDFSFSEDFIQLKSGITYLTGLSPIDSGTGIFIDSDNSLGLSNGDELIAVLSNIEPTTVISPRFLLI